MARKTDTSGNKSISTGEAARLCAVKPDTVLKWIHRGKLKATRTAGGHFRVTVKDLQPYIPEPVSSGTATVSRSDDKLYCWEYRASDGQVQESCETCLVYQSQAERCYVLATSTNTEHGATCALCTAASCEECAYFRYVSEKKIRVLVISCDETLCKNEDFRWHEEFEVRYACCGFDAGSKLQTFQPHMVVLDALNLRHEPEEICRHIREDAKLKDTIILLGHNDPSALENTYGLDSIALRDNRALLAGLRRHCEPCRVSSL